MNERSCSAWKNGSGRRRTASLFGILSLAACLSGPFAQSSAADELQVKLNQTEIEETLRTVDLDVGDPLSVFEAVLRSLPKKVTVYPTENYYYFSFFHKGVNYGGNIRFDAADQFDGKVHFAYSQQYAYWRAPEDPTYRKLGPPEKVKVEKLEKLRYQISYKDISVEFSLVDLSDVRPPETVLRPDETYIGPIWDESGIQFYLLFNRASKAFLYVLNEQAPTSDIFEPLPNVASIGVGARTGFAFYQDKMTPRKILVGVFAGNSRLNNYFDGPFDQLPDNFIEGETLRDALLAYGPWMAGKIDRYGSLPDGSERYAITTYAYYDFAGDLKSIADCAEKETDVVKYYRCFDVVPDSAPAGADGPEGSEPNAQKSP